MKAHLLLGTCIVLFAVSLWAPEVARGEEPTSIGEIRDALRGPWTRVRTEHFRVHSDYSSPIDGYQLRSLEASFSRIANGLSIDEAARESLRQDPIEFYYTRQRGLLESLGGGDAEGLAFPDHRVIVSLRLPHAHEVAHVLLHMASASRAPRSAPVLQEGLATWWGGTAEAATPVILDTAREVVELRKARLEELMTPAGLWNSESDSHDLYALAALFCEFLRQRHSMAALLELHARLADDAEGLDERPARAVIVQFEGLEGASWAEIVKRFEGWSQRQHFGGITAASVVERSPDGDRTVDGHRIRWWSGADGLVVALETLDRRSVDAELLWGDVVRPFAGTDRDQPRWRRWGLRASPDGVQLTDHRSRRRLARLSPAGRSERDSSRWVMLLDTVVLEETGLPEQIELFVTPRFESSVVADPSADSSTDQRAPQR